MGHVSENVLQENSRWLVVSLKSTRLIPQQGSLTLTIPKQIHNKIKCHLHVVMSFGLRQILHVFVKQISLGTDQAVPTKQKKIYIIIFYFISCIVWLEFTWSSRRCRKWRIHNQNLLRPVVECRLEDSANLRFWTSTRLIENIPRHC